MVLPVCGDGVLAGVEACDDGNLDPNDGCNALCEVEANWTCQGAGPGSCSPVCGDGVLLGAETCDDGDNVDGNGCDNTCQPTTGYACTGVGPLSCRLCGDHVVSLGEECDDGATAAGDGCGATCLVERGWLCDATTGCASVCGDGITAGMEMCDDANAGSPGCNACQVAHGYSCSGEPSVCVTTCGDGLVAGAEQCDVGGNTAAPGCDLVTCLRQAGYVCSGEPSACHTVCGDGVRAGAEPCDDGNTVNLDGCSTTCLVDAFLETEPNNTAPQANGPFGHVIIRGSITQGDRDFFSVVVPATADLRIETFDASGPARCANIDTFLTLFAPDGTTVLATDDDGGVGACSLVTSFHLPAGTYVFSVDSFNALVPVPAYSVVISFDALCGDAVVEGHEACDSTPGCTATCDRVPTCGDTVVDAPEQCDDGNTAGGDGCSATCSYELLNEVEPNNTLPTANPLLVNTLVSAAISNASDVDHFTFTVPATADVMVETFGAAGPGTCGGTDTVVSLLGADGTVLVTRDQGALGNCASVDPWTLQGAAARHLAAGTYVVRVGGALGHTVPAYTLRVTFRALCGDGVVLGAEECEAGAGCMATCDRVPTCGDGLVDAPEQCDDGNAVSADGCSSTCQWELSTETEPNDAVATANGPLMPAPTVLFGGAITPAADVDFLAIQLTTTSDLVLETFDGTGAPNCAIIDTLLTLLAPDGTTVLVTDDDSGVATCSRIDAKLYPGAGHLAAGIYYVQVASFGNASAIPAYRLFVRITAVCGNGLVEGAEACDGTANCTPTCDRIPTCGDGYVDGPETCDDGNTAGGDGCSVACALESLAEVEPNDTTAQSDASPVQVTGSAIITGAIGAVGDVDLVRVTLAQDALVRLETFDGSARDCTVATTLRWYDAAGIALAVDDNSGVGSCSALTLFVAAGTYYASVEQRGNTQAVPAYALSIVVVGGSQEVEPNGLMSTATVLAGADTYVLGSHVDNQDVDVFAITVPAGKSLRVETVEGDASETCESRGIDSLLTLMDSTGLVMDVDDDAGRGFCSLLDGTGASPSSPAAHNLPAGTYYLQVEAAFSARAAADTTGQFNYRLVVTVR